MRFLLGMITAAVLVLALIVATAPNVQREAEVVPERAETPAAAQPTPSSGPAPSEAAEDLRRIAGARLEIASDWVELTPEQLAETSQLAPFAAFLAKAQEVLILMNTPDVEDMTGFLIAADMGRTTTEPMEAMTAIEQRQDQLGRSQIEWSPRIEQVGAFESASFAVKLPLRGSIGTRMMRGAYYILHTDDRSLLGPPRTMTIVTMTQTGTRAAAKVDQMLASLTPD